MNCCLQKYTTHQFTYFICSHYLFHEKFRYPKIINIQQVHQKLQAKQLFLFKLFSIGNSFEFKATQETRLIKSCTM